MEITCLVSAVPKIKVEFLLFFFFGVFSAQYIVEEKGRSWHMVKDSCCMQYSAGLKWFPFPCSALEPACSLGTRNSWIIAQSLAAPLWDVTGCCCHILCYCKLVGSKDRNGCRCHKSWSFHQNTHRVWRFYFTSRYAGEIALQFPNGYKLKCCVRNDEPVDVWLFVWLRGACLGWARLCSQPWGPRGDGLDCPEQQNWKHLPLAAELWEDFITSCLGESHWFFSPPLSQAVKCVMDLGHVKVSVQVSRGWENAPSARTRLTRGKGCVQPGFGASGCLSLVHSDN